MTTTENETPKKAPYTAPALPLEWQEALDTFYWKFATKPTNTQKLNILIKELGDCSVSYMGMSGDTPEAHEAVKVRIMELDYLTKIGLHKPTFC